MNMSRTLIAAAVAAASFSAAAGDLSIGATTFLNFPAYKDADVQVYPLPLIKYEGDHFYVDGIEAGTFLFKNENQKVKLGLGWMPQYFDASKSDDAQINRLDDRKSTLAADFSYELEGKFGKVTLGITADLLGESDGYLVHGGYSYTWLINRTAVTPSVGFMWADSKFNDYYYGISATESRRSGLAAYKADSSISPVLGLNVAHRIDANWTVFGSTYMKFLSSEVKDSPMTEGKSAAWTVGAGVMYHFD